MKLKYVVTKEFFAAGYGLDQDVNKYLEELQKTHFVHSMTSHRSLRTNTVFVTFLIEEK